MRILLFLLLFLVSCCNKKDASQSFAYNDNVEITGGFYRGQKGIIIEELHSDYKYLIKVGDKEISVYSENLKKSTL
jgi:hypothetical protein